MTYLRMFGVVFRVGEERQVKVGKNVLCDLLHLVLRLETGNIFRFARYCRPLDGAALLLRDVQHRVAVRLLQLRLGEGAGRGLGGAAGERQLAAGAVRGAAQEGRPPAAGPRPHRAHRVDQRLAEAGLRVLVGAVAQELLQEGAPVLLLRRARLLVQAGAGGHGGGGQALGLAQVELLDGRRQLLPHPHLQRGVQRAQQLPHLVEGLVVGGGVASRQDENLPRNLAHVDVGAAQVEKREVDNLHQPRVVGVGVLVVQGEVVRQLLDDPLEQHESAHDPLPGDALQVPLLQQHGHHEVQAPEAVLRAAHRVPAQAEVALLPAAHLHQGLRAQLADPSVAYKIGKIF